MKITTSISPNYVKNWTVEKAIREILQNWLDTRKEFGCKGKIRYKDGITTAKDFGPGLEPRHLALGISEKGGDAIGKYGEGLKLAMLVMAREGREMQIRSNGNIITPTIEYHETFQTEVMVLNIEPMEPHVATTYKGTSIQFPCTKKELEEGKNYFEYFLSPKNGFEWLDKNHRISLPGGYIYVNGAKVGRIPKADFSYHLYEKETGDIGNRDREVMDHEKVQNEVRKIIGETSSRTVIEKIVQSIFQDNSWEVKIGIPPEMIQENNKKLWKRAFYEIAETKDAVIPSWMNYEDDDQARYLGYKVINMDYGWQNTLRKVGVPDTHTVTNKSSKKSFKKVKPNKELTEEEKNNFRTAKKLVKKYYNDPGKIIISESLEKIGNSASSVITYGLCDNQKQCIYLKKSVLKDLNLTIHILLHETVHKYSGAKDCTTEFEKALTDVAVNMMLTRVRK
ncbi:MAG: hypothetical protein BWX44_00001 [Spirochaetes bacterium ADurb.Bin001]|nr:MAG: hypothetical protein BWX44_00001 [Spirochaetes bacterium ADurb.Bin001]